MKHTTAIALILALLLSLTMPAVAEAPAPINFADVMALQQLGFVTVGDYATALAPMEYAWEYEGEATDVTQFMLIFEGGSVTLSVSDAEGYKDEELGLLGATELEESALAKAAQLTGVYWENDALTQIPLPRGLKLGDGKETLLSLVGGLEIVGLEPGEQEEEYDETASFTFAVTSGSIPADIDDDTLWKEYYGFDFFFNEGALAQVEMIYYTDAE